MTPERFDAITRSYPRLKIAVAGDFCLDRYLEIDPSRAETSIETGLPVHNVVNVRAQPGAAGTILNNLVALGIGTVHPVGFCGDDGEGYELKRALAARAGVQIADFHQDPARRTFTYCKPLILDPGRPPRELNRLDSKNWSPTPEALQDRIADSVRRLAKEVDALILMDQVDVPETGVVTERVLRTVSAIAREQPRLVILADSRRSVRGFEQVMLKMNAAELARLTGVEPPGGIDALKRLALDLAGRQQRNVFVTLAERGIVGAGPGGSVAHSPALPVRGEIDIVGAGDAVTANLAAALAAGAGIEEAVTLANAAASIVIHQLGTTGTAGRDEIRELFL